MLTVNPLTASMAWPVFVFFPTQKRTSGGSSETAVNELTVSARIAPSASVVMIVTPVANCPTVWRNARESIMSKGGVGAGLKTRPYSTDIVRVDEIRYRPAVQVVLGHALLGESLVLRACPRELGDHQRLEADALVIAEVVAFVQLVAAAELGAERIPHQLHHLDAILGAVTV